MKTIKLYDDESPRFWICCIEARVMRIISLPVHRYSKHSQNPTLSKTSRFELGAQNEFLCAQKSFSVCSEIESSAQLSISVHTNQNLLAQPELCARASGFVLNSLASVSARIESG